MSCWASPCSPSPPCPEAGGGEEALGVSGQGGGDPPPADWSAPPSQPAFMGSDSPLCLSCPGGRSVTPSSEGPLKPSQPSCVREAVLGCGHRCLHHGHPTPRAQQSPVSPGRPELQGAGPAAWGSWSMADIGQALVWEAALSQLPMGPSQQPRRWYCCPILQTIRPRPVPSAPSWDSRPGRMAGPPPPAPSDVRQTQ